MRCAPCKQSVNHHERSIHIKFNNQANKQASERVSEWASKLLIRLEQRSVIALINFLLRLSLSQAHLNPLLSLCASTAADSREFNWLRESKARRFGLFSFNFRVHRQALANMCTRVNQWDQVHDMISMIMKDESWCDHGNEHIHLTSSLHLTVIRGMPETQLSGRKSW